MKKGYFLDIPDIILFDAHRHMYSFDEFDSNLTQFNIKKFCLMPCLMENDFQNILSYIEKIKPYQEKYKDKAIVFGSIDFSKDIEQNLRLLEHQKKEISIKGIKLHPEQKFDISKRFLKPYFNSIADTLGFEIPIYIHTDWPLSEERGFVPEKLKDTFDKVVSFFPDFKFIMGHAGGSGAFLNVWKSCKKYKNVYVETSMAPVTSPLEEIVWKIGSDRILFGSNFPYCATQIEIVKILSLYKISDTDKRSILETNAEVLFQW